MDSMCLRCGTLSLRTTKPPTILFRSRPSIRTFSTSLAAQAAPKGGSKAVAAKAKAKRKQKKHATYKLPNLKDIARYTLVDAMQYIKAFEVGRPQKGPKYDLAVRLRTKKDGPVIRGSMQLPHPVKTDIKVCVLCPANSKQGQAAKEAGAFMVGEEEVFDQIKNGKINFDRCLTTPETLPKIMKAGLPRILGPRGMMPSVKLGSVTEDVAKSVQDMMGGSTYRERQGVIRLAIGQIGFTAEQLRNNVQAFIEQVKKEGSTLATSQGFSKGVFEVVSLFQNGLTSMVTDFIQVLSSTHSPGFSLTGDLRGPDSVSTQRLNTA